MYCHLCSRLHRVRACTKYTVALQLQTQTPPYISAHPCFVVCSLLTPLPRGIDVGWALVVRLGEHAHDADEDTPDGLQGRPALGGALVMVWIVAWRV